ncbi:MAG TPA: hypothetical protein VHO70_21640 [Chitinispirillaceae bacterium]|nr:hypothetical protein [Chitinispirillaceae bacterium]
MRLLIILSVIILLTGCGANLPDQFENIEKLRTLAITFDNHGLAEASPGDTVRMRAYLSGEVVRSARWWISTQLISGFLGADTFVDSIPLQQYMIPGSYSEYFGGNTDSIAVDFRIPEDVIRNRFDLLKPVSTLLPGSIPDSTKQKLSSITIGQMFDIIDLASTPGLFSMIDTDTLFGGMLTKQNLSLMLQVFSIQIRISGLVNDYYKLQTSYTVKYNKKMRNAGLDVEVNRNPVIDKVQLFKVYGNKSSFDPQSKDIKKVYDITYETDTISIEKGYSYFLKASVVDSLTDVSYNFGSGNDTTELFYYKWFYRNNDELSDIAMDDLMKIQLPTFDSTTVKILPSLDKRMKHFSIWLAVYDDLFGVRLRPRGFAFKAIEGVFRYSTDY